MKTDLRLRLHATQAQPCFPAASNALALPSGNLIFTATPTERITHYTLLCKVVCQMGALPPLETPTRKGGTLPLHGAHTAFSCYPALRLYRLSKSPRGIDVVSLTLGNFGLPFAHSRGADPQAGGQLLLRQAAGAAAGGNVGADLQSCWHHQAFLAFVVESGWLAFIVPRPLPRRKRGVFKCRAQKPERQEKSPGRFGGPGCPHAGEPAAFRLRLYGRTKGGESGVSPYRSATSTSAIARLGTQRSRFSSR